MTVEQTRPEIEQGQSLPSMFLGLVDRPAVTFRRVVSWGAKRVWLVPLLILVLTMCAALAAQAPYSAELARQQAQRQLALMPTDQAEAAKTQIETFTTVPAVLVSSLLTGILMLAIGLAAQAGFFHFGSLVLGGESAFGDSLKVSVWTRLPQMLRYLVTAVFTLVAGRQVQYPGLSALVASGEIMEDAKNPMVALLSGIDPFWIWHLWLVVVGVSVLANFKRSRSIGLTVVYAILSVLVVVVPTMIFGSAGG